MIRLLQMTVSVVAALCAFVSLSLAPASATDYPTRQINLIVSTGAGGAADAMARIVASALEKEWGKTVVVINRPGGGGATAAAQVKNEAPDGYTLFVANTGIVTMLWQIVDTANFTNNDFTYIRSLNSSSCAWVTSANSPYKTLKDVWAAAKAGKAVSFAGTGVPDKMFVDFVSKKEGVELAVPIFKSVTEALQAALAGHVDLAFSGGSHAPFVKDKTMRVLAATGDQRTVDSPEVPTLKEMGYDVSFCSMHAILAPKGLPAEIANKVAAAADKAMLSPEAQKFVETRGDTLVNEGPEALAKRMKDETAAFSALKSSLK